MRPCMCPVCVARRCRRPPHSSRCAAASPPAPLPCACRSKPAIKDTATSDKTADAVITPPATAPTGGWLKYEITVCPTANDPAGCVVQTCENTPAGTPFPAPPTTFTCKLTGLTELTEYRTKVVAVNGATKSAVSDPDVFTTLKATNNPPTVCVTDVDCAPWGKICDTTDPNTVGARKCICATGYTDCGGKCIDGDQQCCPADPSKGVTCPASYTAGSTTVPAQTCDGASYLCKCATGFVKCGKICIDPAKQCCVTDLNVSKCATPNLCSADGGVCVAACPAGTTQCGQVCVDATKGQCCSNAAISQVGSLFNGGCFAAPFCGITKTFSGVDSKGNAYSQTGTIIGKVCSDGVCRECCVDSDCVGAAVGQKCNNGVCLLNGCSTFACWKATTKQVCKLRPGPNDASSCAACGATTVFRCPNSMACDPGATQGGCKAPQDGNFCQGASDIVCIPQVTSCGTTPSMQGRECGGAAQCKASNGLAPDPFFSNPNTTPPNVVTYSGISGYVGPNCPTKRRMGRRLQ